MKRTHTGEAPVIDEGTTDCNEENYAAALQALYNIPLETSQQWWTFFASTGPTSKKHYHDDSNPTDSMVHKMPEGPERQTWLQARDKEKECI